MKNPGPLEAYEALVLSCAAPPHADALAELRRAFEGRTGAFGPEDPWFEVRSRAFWDDALTTQGFARDAALSAGEELVPWGLAFSRAHRGLFERYEDRAVTVDDGCVLVRDVISGAAFVVDVDPAIGDAVFRADGFFDARLVGVRGRVGMLPGAVFHRTDARAPILEVVKRASEKGMHPDRTLDALLRMELRLTSLSRVKVAYAYRAEGL